MKNLLSFQVCNGIDECPLGEDENSEDWFSSEAVVTGSFSREQLRVWGENYLKSSGTTDEKISSICLRKDTKIFLLFTILVCTVVALVLLLPVACLVSLFLFCMLSI